MSGCRMGYDLLTWVGWRNLWAELRFCRFHGRLVALDTIRHACGRFLCRLVGSHASAYDSDVQDAACATCGQWRPRSIGPVGRWDVR